MAITIIEIQAALAAAEPAAPEKKKATPKKAQAPVSKANGRATLTPDEQLAFQAGRIIAALALEQKGVTVEALVNSVRQYEHYTGPIQ